MTTPVVFDRILTTSTTTGTGDFFAPSNTTGYQGFSAVSGKVFYCIEHPGTNNWETGIGSYTPGTSYLTRGYVIASSNSNALVNFGAGTKNVFVTVPASQFLNDVGVCEGRLTLSSGVPVTTSDVTGATTVYFTPYKGNRISLCLSQTYEYWVTYEFSELSLSLGTLTSGLPYDVFIYDNSGTLTLEKVAWTNGTTRATDLATQNGVLIKSGDVTRRYLGTFYTTSTTQTEDSESKRYLWNYHNRFSRTLYKTDANGSWTYSTASFRQANNSASNQVEVVIGYQEVLIDLECVTGFGTSSASAVAPKCGIGEDSTSTSSARTVTRSDVTSAISLHSSISRMVKYPTVGRHYYAWLEYGATGCTFYGNNGAGSFIPGLQGTIEG